MIFALQMEIPEGYILIKKADYESLLQRIADLEARLNKTSVNSHKPPSSDGYKKALKNNREKSTRKQGGQFGHKGSTLEMVSNPDKIITHKVAGLCSCGLSLDGLSVKKIHRKQEFELAAKLIEVTEHCIEEKHCSCVKIHKAVCHLQSSAQYGNNLKSLMVYLNQQQFVPYERLQEFSKDVLGISISDGLLQDSNQKCYTNLSLTEESIKSALLQSEVMHNDETGIRCESANKWVHSASTSKLTHYSIHNKRGVEAMDAIGILPNYTGITVHDRWKSYNQYTNATHAYCNAHLLRDLKYINEEHNSKWALEMKLLLMEANTLKKQAELNANSIAKITNKYSTIIENALKEEPPDAAQTQKKRGRKPKSKTRLLLDVFINHQQKVLLFMYNKSVSFDNNLAERDIRMVKLKQKISGCFRTIEGAEVFCRIRSVISTARKNGVNILDTISAAISGNPIKIWVAEL